MTTDDAAPGREAKGGDYRDSLPHVSQQLPLLCGVSLHSRLWAGFAGRQRATEPVLERRDPFWPPQRAADGRGTLDPGRRRVSRHGEKRREIRDQCAQRRHRCELVILARELRPSARPCQSSARLTNPATTGLRAM
jgi:hypothetical protein